jgi:hypothetical protein
LNSRLGEAGEPIRARLRGGNQQPFSEFVRGAAQAWAKPTPRGRGGRATGRLRRGTSSLRARSGTTRDLCRSTGADRAADPTTPRTPRGSCCRRTRSSRPRAEQPVGARPRNPSSRPRSAGRRPARAQARDGCRGSSRTCPRTARRPDSTAPGARRSTPRTAASARPTPAPRPHSRARANPARRRRPGVRPRAGRSRRATSPAGWAHGPQRARSWSRASCPRSPRPPTRARLARPTTAGGAGGDRSPTRP